MKTDADHIEEHRSGNISSIDGTMKKRQLRKKETCRTVCRETLAMKLFQKAMEALEAMDAASLSATNVVHLLEIAAKLEKISGESGERQKEALPQDPVTIYLPDNGREPQQTKE